MLKYLQQIWLKSNQKIRTTQHPSGLLNKTRCCTAYVETLCSTCCTSTSKLAFLHCRSSVVECYLWSNNSEPNCVECYVWSNNYGSNCNTIYLLPETPCCNTRVRIHFSIYIFEVSFLYFSHLFKKKETPQIYYKKYLYIKIIFNYFLGWNVYPSIFINYKKIKAVTKIVHALVLQIVLRLF